ncbi:DUF6879 family protein [Streptomyces yaizuensis]|uniref:DUF6879 domain-containing protein n=1 Tax=Streptomyces yaizuensis TaxID=2989713 RepID=A0ABQ5P3V4_9ACTN|nr:DUF6879 family protein [Streptomyces sp. YSPA8]GLF97279.1 hypothetical protein SYYSPA8_23300 [Streptomyces sp. YSPA8]
MRDDTALLLDGARGERLSRSDYQRDFRLRDAENTGQDDWKFERRQHFQEPGSPSWEAFRRGEWDEAVRLLGERREHWAKVAREDRARGGVFHRVRVVEEPLTPYLHWELHALRVQAECGMPVRVVSGERIAAWEESGPLPEVVVLAGRVLYEVKYTEAGVLDGAVRFLGTETVQGWERFIRDLFEAGEDLPACVDRWVSALPPPRPTAG